MKKTGLILALLCPLWAQAQIKISAFRSVTEPIPYNVLLTGRSVTSNILLDKLHWRNKADIAIYAYINSDQPFSADAEIFDGFIRDRYDMWRAAIKFVTVFPTHTELDIEKMIRNYDFIKNELFGVFPTTIYIADYRRGFRVEVINGRSLLSNGFIIASPSPVYVVGDYNTVNARSAAVIVADTVTSNSTVNATILPGKQSPPIIGLSWPLDFALETTDQPGRNWGPYSGVPIRSSVPHTSFFVWEVLVPVDAPQGFFRLRLR